MEEYVHSVTLDSDACRGCITCVKRCPTEAIRVRNGKARILKERCIDCGECIRVIEECIFELNVQGDRMFYGADDE